MGKCFSKQKKIKNPQIEQQNDQMQKQTIKAQKAGINVMLDENAIIEEDVTIKNQNIQNLIYLNDQKIKKYGQQNNNEYKEVILEKETVNDLYGSKENKQQIAIEKSKEKIIGIEESQLLQDSLSYLKLTVIQAINLQQADKKYLQNEYLIGEKGFQNSLQPSDSTYIGLSGDIQLHPEDICEEKQLQIQFMNENFYFIDHGKKIFTLIQITKEKSLKLRKNLLIQLGEQNLFTVLEIQEPQQFTQEILKDQYLVIEFDSISDNKFQESTSNENPIPKLKIQFLKGEHKNKIFEMDTSHNLLLGRSQKCKQGVQFRDMKIHHEHGMQAFKYRIEFNQQHGWIFKDCGSISGSWVVVKDNYTKFENGVTSLPLKVQNNMQFKVGSNTIFQVNIFNAKTTLPKEEEDQVKIFFSQQ